MRGAGAGPVSTVTGGGASCSHGLGLGHGVCMGDGGVAGDDADLVHIAGEAKHSDVAGATVTDGWSQKHTAPSADGLYPLYQYVQDGCLMGFRWEVA